MRVLVTGGLGCIGSQIARSLFDEGHEVVIIDSAAEERNQWIANQLRLKYDPEIHFDCLEYSANSLRDILPYCDAVIHAAASTGIPHSALHPDDDWASNVDATKVLLDALRKHPLPTVVLSSVKPYATSGFLDQDGDPLCGQQSSQMQWHGGLKETDQLAPDEPYAASKAAQSMLAMAWARSYDLPVVTLRCSNLYGPAPCHGPRHGWLTWFCIAGAMGRDIEVQGGGAQARDMLYGSDVASACWAAIRNLQAERVLSTSWSEIDAKMDKSITGKVFNIGGGYKNVTSVMRMAIKVQGMTGCRIVEAPGRKHEDQLVFVDHSRFTEATGWRPLVNVEEGSDRVLRWAAENETELQKVYEGVK